MGHDPTVSLDPRVSLPRSHAASSPQEAPVGVEVPLTVVAASAMAIAVCAALHEGGVVV